MSLLRVLTATPYRPCNMDSLGKAEYMYLLQFKFPNVYDTDLDKLVSADCDRIRSWDRKYTEEVNVKHLGVAGMTGLSDWVLGATTEEIFAYLKAVLKADPEVKWTGFRLLGTVNRSNGYPVHTLQLFSNVSKKKTYTGPRAPNISKLGWAGARDRVED